MFRKHCCSACFIILSAVILAACNAAAESPTPLPPTNTPLPPTPTIEPTQSLTSLEISPTEIKGLVDVGGRRLQIECQGEGSPTIILESGMYSNSSTWLTNNLFSDLGTITRACRYSRANVWPSDSVETPRTTQDMVSDLHTMLVNAQIPGPYVLVGHSHGGWIVILYADQYPDEVAGIVLLDPSPWDFALRMAEVLPTQSTNESGDLVLFRSYIKYYYEPASSDPEGWDLYTSAEQLRAVTSLGDIPLTVLTGSASSFFMSSPEINQLCLDTWLDLHLELAALSTNYTQKTIQDASHMLWLDQPEEVLNWIVQMVETLRE